MQVLTRVCAKVAFCGLEALIKIREGGSGTDLL